METMETIYKKMFPSSNHGAQTVMQQQAQMSQASEAPTRIIRSRGNNILFSSETK